MGFKLREKLFKRTICFWYLHMFVNYLWNGKGIRPLRLLNNLFASIWMSDKYKDIIPRFLRFNKKDKMINKIYNNERI